MKRRPAQSHRRLTGRSRRNGNAAVVSSHDAILASDREGRLTAFNGGAERMYGYRADEVLGRPAAFLSPPERREETASMRRRVLGGERVDEFQTERLRRDGTRFAVALSADPIVDARGHIVGVATIQRDVSERVRIEADRARLAALVEHSADAIVAIDLEGRVTAWNQGATMLFGFSEREVLGRQGWALVPTADGHEQEPPPELLRGETVRRESTRRRRDGTEVVIASTLSPIRDGSGSVIGAVGVSRDVTLQRRAETQLQEATARFAAAFTHAPIGMALIGLTDGRIAEANPAMCDMTGYEQQDLIGFPARELLHPEERDAMTAYSAALRAGEATVAGETRYLHRDGSIIFTYALAALVGDTGFVVLQVQDVSERKRYEGQLRYLTDYDALTGIFNRRRFQEELEWIVDHGRRSGESAAVLVVDLDHFKYINDTYGHAAGDELLGWLAGTLRERVRKSDILGRLGGNVFGVILPGTPAAGAAKLADELLRAARQRSAVGRARTSVSIGLTLVDGEPDLDAAELLAQAETALFDAKERGRDRVSVAGAGGGAAPERLRTQMTWAERIRGALEGEGFVLYEQPIVGVRSGRAERSELLIRMLADDGVIAPGQFLPIAERFGLMKEIDRWVIARAIRLLAERQAAGLGWLGVDVNLSGESITDPSVMDFIAAEVRNAPIDPTCLIFEVTETSAIVNMERARTLADGLAELGCQFALDDFGAGFGSFYYLKYLPFDMVKIDGDFIKSLPTSRTDQLTVRAIVQIAAGLGKQTTAEFVGDDQTVDLLSELGVDFAQGYHMGKPRAIALRPDYL